MILPLLLLKLYPRAWRNRYEEEFSALIEQSHLSLFDMADVAFGALDAHLRPQVPSMEPKKERSIIMIGSAFPRRIGLAIMVGSVLILASVFALSFSSDPEYPYSYGADDIVASLGYGIAVALLMIGIVGLAKIYGKQSGSLGQVGLVISFIALGGMLYGSVGNLAEKLGAQNFSWWDVNIFSILGLGVGTSLFAATTLRGGFMSRSAGYVPVAGTVGLIVTLFLSTGLFEFPRAIPEITLLIVALASLITLFAGWFLMGRDLRDGRQAALRHTGEIAV